MDIGSFIKRKGFTRRLDIVHRVNLKKDVLDIKPANRPIL